MELIIGDGHFKLNSDTKIIVNSNDDKVKDLAQYFVEQFNTASGNSLKVIVSKENNSKLFKI